jgi:hypothetical protein
LPWFSAPVEQLSQNIDAERLQQLLDEGEALTVESANKIVFEIV